MDLLNQKIVIRCEDGSIISGIRGSIIEQFSHRYNHISQDLLKYVQCKDYTERGRNLFQTKDGSLSVFTTLIGRGSYGSVYSHGYLPIVSKDIEVDDSLRFIVEVAALSLLKTLNDPHLLPIYSIYDFSRDERDYLRINMKRYCTTLEKARPFTVKEVTYWILYNLFQASTVGLIHRDVKPGNVFINGREIVLGDWGLSTWTPFTIHRTYLLSGTVQTLWYRSPEVLCLHYGVDFDYDEKIDVWSVGAIMYEYKKTPFICNNEDTLFYLMCKKFKFHNEVDDDSKCAKCESYKKLGVNERNKAIGKDLNNLIESSSNCCKSIFSNKDEDSLVSSMLTISPKFRTSIVDALNSSCLSKLREGNVFRVEDPIMKLPCFTSFDQNKVRISSVHKLEFICKLLTLLTDLGTIFFASSLIDEFIYSSKDEVIDQQELCEYFVALTNIARKISDSTINIQYRIYQSITNRSFTCSTIRQRILQALKKLDYSIYRNFPYLIVVNREKHFELYLFPLLVLAHGYPKFNSWRVYSWITQKTQDKELELYYDEMKSTILKESVYEGISYFLDLSISNVKELLSM